MKRIFSLLVAIALLLSAASAFADVDLSGMSYDELVNLKDQINLAIWNSTEWQEVTVPQGVWVVGEDIPEGTWTIKASPSGGILTYMCHISYGEYLTEDGRNIRYKGNFGSTIVYDSTSEYYEDGQQSEFTLTVKKGEYIVIGSLNGKAIFTPYAGKQPLGFK